MNRREFLRVMAGSPFLIIVSCEQANTQTMNISYIGASLACQNPALDDCCVARLATRLKLYGADQVIVNDHGRDGMTNGRAESQAVFGNPGWTTVWDVIMAQPNWVLNDLAINDALFNVDNISLQQAETNAANTLAALKSWLPSATYVYVSIIPPAQFTYNGTNWVTANTNWAAFDAYMQQLYGKTIVMNYAAIVNRFGTADGIHPAFQAPIMMAAYLVNGLRPYLPDLQLPNYAPFEDPDVAMADPNWAITKKNLGVT